MTMLDRRIARLTNKIAHYHAQLERFAARATPQEKRCHTRAVRALRRCATDLDRLISQDSRPTSRTP